MKIALYYPWIHLTSGVERTILETVTNSKHDYVIFTNHFEPRNTFPEFKKFNVVKLKDIPVRRNILDVIRASFIIMFQKIDLNGFDKLVVHSEGLGDLILIRNHSIPVVCYCHTPLRPVFDLKYQEIAVKTRSRLKRIIYYIFSTFFKIIDRHIWKRYSSVIFNSKETLNRAIEGKLIKKSSKFKIIHPGVNIISKKPSKIFQKFFFLPGRITWTKNIEMAIEAFRIFKINKKYEDFKLVIAGQVDKKSSVYYKKLKGKYASKDIIFKINLTDKQMHSLYKSCYATLAAAFNEDWGITPIESNSFGKPTICTNGGGFKESQINGVTGYLVDENSNDFASAMTKLASNIVLTKKMGKQAFSNSLKYIWTKFIKDFDQTI